VTGTLVIRADAGAEIGTGHVMRCLALAQAWQEEGGQAVFVLSSEAPALHTRIKAEGMEVRQITVQPASREDAQETAGFACKLDARWVVVDGYSFGADYQRILKDSGLQLLFVDDYGHAGCYHADLVLNQNIHANEGLYLSRALHSQLLLGTRYALLRREFWPWQGRERVIPEVACKVIVTMGGSDPDNVTLKVIEALQHVGIRDLEAVVVVGNCNPHLQELDRAIRHSKVPIRLEHNVTDMTGLMAWADLAVSAGGSTCWELAFMGLPSLVLVQAENQEPIAAGLEAANGAVSLGYAAGLTTLEITQAIIGLANAPHKRRVLAQCGQKLVDGMGALRVVRQMQGGRLTLRPVQADDCHLIWEWANDPAARTVSFSPEPIPWDQHEKWFAARLTDPNTIFYIALDASGVPVGQVRYQIEGREAIISVSLAPEQRGKGYGSILIQLASDKVLQTQPVEIIHAYVKPENAVSARAFRKAGFTESGTVSPRGKASLCYVLQKDTV